MINKNIDFCLNRRGTINYLTFFCFFKDPVFIIHWNRLQFAFPPQFKINIKFSIMKSNNRKIILFCFLLSLLMTASTSLMAVNTDSLKIELGKAKEDTAKVELLITLSDALIDSEPGKAKTYAEQAQKLSETLHYPHGIASGLDLIGELLYNDGDYQNSLEFFLKAAAVNDPDSLNLCQVYVDLGNVYMRQADYISSIGYYVKASKIYEKAGKRKNNNAVLIDNAVVLMDLGRVYKKMGNSPKALEYYYRSLELFKSLNSWKNEIRVNNNIASVYLEQKADKKALEIASQTMELGIRYNDKNAIQNCYGIMGSAYVDMKNYPAAISYFEKAIVIEEEMNNPFYKAISMANLGKAYMESNQLNKAADYLKKAFDYFKENKLKGEMKDVYNDLSKIYEKQNDFKNALKYHQLYSTLNDSIYNEQNSQQVNELSAKYEDEKRKREIALLNANVQSKQKDAELLNTKIQKRNSIIYGTVAGAIFLLLTIVLLFNRRRLIQRSEHQQEINKQREAATASVVQAEENERTRIAKDLHDGVGSFLSTLKINLLLYEEVIPSEKSAGYQHTLDLIDKTAVELRNIMKNLSNETLQEAGIVNAFEELITRLNKLNVTRFDFHTHGMSEKSDKIIELNLYRIGQELLTNCVKYARASNATLQLIADENSITLMLEDNGIGFDPQNIILKNKDHGMGIKNIHDRVSFINGTIRIESTPENGSLFVIEVPKI